MSEVKIKKEKNKKFFLLRIFSVYELSWLGTTLFFAIIFPLIIDLINDGNINWDYYFTLIATFFGLLSVLFVAKKNILNVPFGIIEVSIYGILAFIMGYFVDGLINIVVVLPIIIFTGILWSKNKEEDSKLVVKPRRLTPIGWVLTFLIIIILFISFFLTIHYYNPLSEISLVEQIIDSLNTSTMITAMVLMLFRFSQQWYFWIAFNILTIILYSVGLSKETGDMVAHATSTIITTFGYFVNSIYGLITWNKNNPKI